ncbi:RNA polymerase alpha subunit C-terminal domain-containing protein [Planococcus maritimus]|nr:RNA polymerase alpha subunit C-terminal domain-containing protein [Planococcus sp. SK3692]MDE4085345.1 RNA polymerase alpha subunit C-terminal domain-containing protein [Planococcus maritimus]
MALEKTLRICDHGHRYYKSSDCPTCPVCNEEHKPHRGFLRELSAPARNALLQEQIDTLEKLADYSEKDILTLHGVGPASLPVLRLHLAQVDLAFKS